MDGLRESWCIFIQFSEKSFFPCKGISMLSDLTPLIVGLMVFIAGLISLRLALSVAIIEIVLGAIAGNLGLQSTEWMRYLAMFGGIILTFLAGTEIDTKVMKQSLKECILIGGFSFLIPFVVVALVAYYLLHWEVRGSLIAGIALSTTSLAVVYSVLIESNLSGTRIGKLLMASTFITDMGTALALSIIFIKPTWFTALFYAVSIVVIVVAARFSHLLFNHATFRNKVVESEIKYIFLLLLALIYFAKIGESHAVLPAFILGLVMAKYFGRNSDHHIVIKRLRTVAYAVITPIFFIVGGLRISFPMIMAGIGLFALFFGLKIGAKFLGVYFFAKRYIPGGHMYTTLLMSTGLTFGTISSLFGLQAGIITQAQYSILVGVVVASAVIPTFIAQKWFRPVEDEDLLE
jgi:Kef-type K+ transport system membrane component KefB